MLASEFSYMEAPLCANRTPELNIVAAAAHALRHCPVQIKQKNRQGRGKKKGQEQNKAGELGV